MKPLRKCKIKKPEEITCQAVLDYRSKSAALPLKNAEKCDCKWCTFNEEFPWK